jgi:hypothetical protein
MDARKIEVPYDPVAEQMMHRVMMLRFGVPQRVLDKLLPVDST